MNRKQFSISHFFSAKNQNNEIADGSNISEGENSELNESRLIFEFVQLRCEYQFIFINVISSLFADPDHANANDISINITLDLEHEKGKFVFSFMLWFILFFLKEDAHFRY